MIDFFLSYLLVYTYLALFFITLVSSYIVFVPVWAIIIASWAFAAQGYLDINYVLLFSFLWLMIWNISIYFLSYYYWKNLLVKIKLWKIFNSPKYSWLEKYFINNSIKSILLTRFIITWLNSFVNIISWLTKIRYQKFISLNFIWEVVHVFLFAYLWFLLSSQWELIASVIQYLIIILVLFAILILIIRYIIQHK